MKQLITSDNVNKENVNGYTPLFYAVEFNHYTIVEYLIKIGAEVDQDSFGETPLDIIFSSVR